MQLGSLLAACYFRDKLAVVRIRDQPGYARTGDQSPGRVVTLQSEQFDYLWSSSQKEAGLSLSLTSFFFQSRRTSARCLSVMDFVSKFHTFLLDSWQGKACGSAEIVRIPRLTGKHPLLVSFEALSEASAIPFLISARFLRYKGGSVLQRRIGRPTKYSHTQQVPLRIDSIYT